MKTKLSFFLAGLLLAGSVYGQSAGDFNFQSVAIDASGQPIPGPVSIKLSILNGSPTGPVDYSEEHFDVPLGPGGQFSLGVGLGLDRSGRFHMIDWRADAKYLLVEIKHADDAYKPLGLPQLMVFNGASSDFNEGPVPVDGERSSSASDQPGPYAFRVDQSGEYGLVMQRAGNGDHWEQWVDPAGNLNFWQNDAPVAFLNHNGLWIDGDLNLKKNWSELPRLLPALKRLRPVRYELKGETNGQQYLGFFGREVQQIFPELVEETTDKQGQPHLAIHPAGFGVIAIKVIQEQQQTIEYLIRRLEVLEIKVRDLESN